MKDNYEQRYAFLRNGFYSRQFKNLRQVSESTHPSYEGGFGQIFYHLFHLPNIDRVSKTPQYDEITRYGYIQCIKYYRVPRYDYSILKNIYVVLKYFDNSNFTEVFLQEVRYQNRLSRANSNIVKCYGISKDPKNDNFIMVMQYINNGNIRNYLDNHFNELALITKLDILHKIAVAEDLNLRLNQWVNDIRQRKNTEIFKQFAKFVSAQPSTPSLYETDPKAIYTSRLLDFKNLPEPQNSIEINNEFYDSLVGTRNSELRYYGVATACCNNTTLKPGIYG
ncbi:7622_t:CDS:2, partial [Funneliformis mosseae]